MIFSKTILYSRSLQRRNYIAGIIGRNIKNPSQSFRRNIIFIYSFLCHLLRCASRYSSGDIPNLSLNMLMKFSAVMNPTLMASSERLMSVRSSSVQACLSLRSRTSSAGVFCVMALMRWKKGTLPMPIAVAISSRLICPRLMFCSTYISTLRMSCWSMALFIE